MVKKLVYEGKNCIIFIGTKYFIRTGLLDKPLNKISLGYLLEDKYHCLQETNSWLHRLRQIEGFYELYRRDHVKTSRTKGRKLHSWFSKVGDNYCRLLEQMSRKIGVLSKLQTVYQ